MKRQAILSEIDWPWIAIDVAGNMQTTKRRTQKVYEDILGRVYKTEIWDLDGAGSAPYSTVKTTFNGRDQAILGREYAGSDSSSTYQDTTFTFDGHGRPLTKHLPEYDTSAVTSWTYNADDTPATVTDPRGAVTNYTYGNPGASEKRSVLTDISYSVPQGSTILVPANIAFAYDPAGNRTSMTDASGSLTYAYDELSRLKTETKDFADSLANAPSGGVYTLSYNYHLTGGIGSITDPFGSVVSYTSDAVGRTTAIGGSGFGSVTSFASGISYRAFGGVKSMSYSTADATNITLSYDNRLRVSEYEAASAANLNSIQDKSYSYNPDGSINEAVDNLASNFTQYYDYDFAGRLKRNEFGTGSPGAGKPYKQLLGYDAFSNITSRQTWTWDFGEATFAAAYTNHRKTQGGFESGADYHDAAGNVVQNLVSSTTDVRKWKFDAAGGTNDWEERVPYLTTVRDDGAEMTRDGDGRVAKVIKRVRSFGVPDPQWGYTPEYFIYSSVTGQKITELNDTGAKRKTSVYLGTSAIAEHGCVTSGCGVVFRNIDPVAGTIKSTDPSGAHNTADRTDLEPLGAMIPLAEEEVHTPNYNENSYGFAGNPEMGCSGGIFNGPMPCNVAETEARYEDGFIPIEQERRRKKGQPIFDPLHGPELPDDFLAADNVRHTRKGFRRISVDTGLRWADGWKPIYEDVWVVDRDGKNESNGELPVTDVFAPWYIKLLAVHDAYRAIKNDPKCARFFGLVDNKGRFSKRKLDALGQRVNYIIGQRAGRHIAVTVGNTITLQSNFFNDGIWIVSPKPFSRKNPRQGRAQTILHELGHVLGLLISPDEGGYPDDPESPGNQNEKSILENCEKGLDTVRTSYPSLPNR